MTPTEAVKLTKLVKSVCPQQAMDEFTADAWAVLLADLRFEDCTLVVRRLITAGQVFIAPGEIITAVRKIRAERIETAPPLDPPPDLSPRETIEWLRETRRAIADGTHPEPVAAIEQARTKRDMRFLDHVAKSA